MLSLCKCYHRPILFSALCSLPAIGHAVYTHVAANDNDAITFSLELNRRTLSGWWNTVPLCLKFRFTQAFLPYEPAQST
jgi:hypothetical protein